MPTQRIVLTSSLNFFLGLATMVGVAAATPAWSEEYRGTWEQQMACTPDVMRLCSDQIPDVTRIVACLRQNTPQLSNNCRTVFESNASAQPQTAPRAPQQAAPRSQSRNARPIAPPNPNSDE